MSQIIKFPQSELSAMVFEGEAPEFVLEDMASWIQDHPEWDVLHTQMWWFDEENIWRGHAYVIQSASCGPTK